jgi:hypothetical protein
MALSADAELQLKWTAGLIVDLNTGTKEPFLYSSGFNARAELAVDNLESKLSFSRSESLQHNTSDFHIKDASVLLQVGVVTHCDREQVDSELELFFQEVVHEQNCLVAVVPLSGSYEVGNLYKHLEFAGFGQGTLPVTVKFDSAFEPLTDLTIHIPQLHSPLPSIYRSRRRSLTAYSEVPGRVLVENDFTVSPKVMSYLRNSLDYLGKLGQAIKDDGDLDVEVPFVGKSLNGILKPNATGPMTWGDLFQLGTTWDNQINASNYSQCLPIEDGGVENATCPAISVVKSWIIGHINSIIPDLDKNIVEGDNGHFGIKTASELTESSFVFQFTMEP